MKATMALVILGLFAVAPDARAADSCEDLAEEVWDVRSWAPDRGEVIVEREHEWCIEDEAIGEAREVYTWYEVLDRNGKAIRWFVAGNEIQQSQFAVRMLKGEVPPEALFGEDALEEYEKARKFEDASTASKSPSGACTVKVDTTAKAVFPITAHVIADGKPVWSDSPRSGTGSGRKYEIQTWWAAGADLLLIRYALPGPSVAPKSGKGRPIATTVSEMTFVSAYREPAIAPCFKK